MQRLDHQEQSTKDAREFTNEGFAFTRRIIALTSVFSIILIPIVAGALYPGMPITYGHEQPGFGFLLFNTPETLKFTTSYGITILPLHTHIISAIIGMYFGHSTVK